MTPREAAIAVYGLEAVKAYGIVKRFFTRYGHALERTFAAAVGGRVGARGRRGVRSENDVITRLGGFEFCAAANSKNSAGNAADRARRPLAHVQATGRPMTGRISGVDFLRMHGVRDAERIASECQVEALRLAKEPEPPPQLWAKGP